jgi:hypothetical protein
MTGQFPRSLSLALAIASLGASLPALSQVRVNVTTASSPPATCVMTTDASGLSLVPGTTDLKATGVTFSPAGCGQGTGLPPPTPPNFQLSGVPASGTAPLSFTVTWDLVNAVTCTGSATKDGATTTIAGWTDSNAASPQSRSLTLTQAGTYALTLTCGNGASPPATITSRVATVTVSGGGGGGDGGSCQGPAGLTRLTQSNITYGPVNLTARPNVDVKEWNNIWGHGTPSDGVTPWPGVNGAGPVIRQFGRTNFLAAHFNTGAHGEPTYGVLAYASNIGGPNVDIRISQTCGDFSANAANPACLVQAASDDSPAIRWKFGTGNTGSYCNLLPNTDYYINIKFHDPASPVECPVGSSVCPFYTVNNGNW